MKNTILAILAMLGGAAGGALYQAAIAWYATADQIDLTFAAVCLAGILSLGWCWRVSQRAIEALGRADGDRNGGAK